MNQKYLLAFAYELEGEDVFVRLKATAENISSFIIKNKGSPFIQLETLDGDILLNARYGFIDKCYDPDYLNDLLDILVPMQHGDIEIPELITINPYTMILTTEIPEPDWDCSQQFRILTKEQTAEKNDWEIEQE